MIGKFGYTNKLHLNLYGTIIFAILATFLLNIPMVSARMIEKSDIETPSDFSENAIRRFEIVSLISLPFTAIHSYLAFRGIEMIHQREFSPEISGSDYYIIGGMAVTFSAFIGFWDWYHTRGQETSQPKIPKSNKIQYGKYNAQQNNLNYKSHLSNYFSNELFVLQLYQKKF